MVRKNIVHDSNKLRGALERFIVRHTRVHRSSFEVSDVKRDGTVFVRFRSSPYDPAMYLAEAFRGALWAHGLQFVQTDDTKFRLPLEQFSSVTV